LDGLPLAIELAAARVRLFSPQQILDRLDNRLRFLTGGARDLPSRQRTLRGAIDWSYNLLDDDERQLFARLVVFTGGRSLEAVDTVCAPGLDIDVLDGVSSLLDKSLLVRGEGPAGESRFYMLQTIREYAAERLANSGEAQQLQARHLTYFLAQCEEMETGYRQHGQLLLLKRTAAELGNLRAAFHYALASGRPGEAARLIASIDYYLRYRDRLVEGHRWFQQLLHLHDQIPRPIQARFLLGAGRLSWVNGALEQSHKLFLRGLEVAQATDNRRVAAWLLVELSVCAFRIDGRDLSLQRCEQGLATFRKLDDLPGIATAYNNLGEVARLSGDYEQARAMYEACLATCRKTGEITRQIMQSHNLAYIAYRQGDFARARDLNKSCLEQMVEIGWKHGSIDTLWNLAGPLTWLGQEEKAARLLGASAALLVEMGVVPHPSDIHELALYTADVRARLDETAFETMYAEGGAMTLPQAVDYALAE
jgi:tetratricopeptide (TPR) repeat protein